MEDRKYSSLTESIICCFYIVYNSLGYGFLEKVYENALALELKSRDMLVAQQFPIAVYYAGHIVGEYFSDLMVEDKILIEIKAVRSLMPEHEAQLLNYLRATDIEVGLLLNFGPDPEVRRKAFDNTRKADRTLINAEKADSGSKA
ncbi:MAG: GxxExxY protein [Desulfuromonadales bacterium]|nr:GxxExxY protein [Desulfuromonadales bacterium]MDT8424182.1 GxxExxY protein [Desulfuromonadales bacterium]